MTTSTADTGRMAVRHRRLDPVFIVGHGRSGTSILTNLVRKYLGVAFGTESQFFVRYHRQLGRYGDLTRDANLARLVRDISAERFFQRSRKYGLQLDAARVVRECEPRTYTGVLSAIFRQCAEGQHLARWGDKTPEYTRHLPLLLELFPNAQFIHVVRDGRDVALSGYQMHFGCKNAYTAAREWREVVDDGQRFGTALTVGAFIEVRYEDLLAAPGDVFERLIRFLDIDAADGALNRFVRERIRPDVRAANSDKWKRQLSPADQAMFAAVAGETLRQSGYEVPARLPAPPGPLGRIYWEADNVVRRMARPDYWGDNFYKAGLRLRECVRPLRRRSGVAALTPTDDSATAPGDRE